MPRPRKPEKEKLVGASIKVTPQTAQKIEMIVRAEGSDSSKVVRRLIEAGLEARDRMTLRGSVLAPRLVEMLKQLPIHRQYDLLAIADALISRERFENTHSEAEQTENLSKPKPVDNPRHDRSSPSHPDHATREESPYMDTIETLLKQIEQYENEGTQESLENAQRLHAVIADLKTRGLNASPNDISDGKNSNSRNTPDSPNSGH